MANLTLTSARYGLIIFIVIIIINEGRYTALDEWLSTAQIAKERNLKTSTVQSWCRKGWLPAEQIGRAYRVKRADWDAFLKNGLQPAKKFEGQTAQAAWPQVASFPTSVGTGTGRLAFP